MELLAEHSGMSLLARRRSQYLEPDVLKKRALVGPLDVPEPEIVLVNSHLSAPPNNSLPGRRRMRDRWPNGTIDGQSRVAMGVTTYVLAA